MKILLLNPPSQKKILRDYFCSESSKAAYYWPPIDLLVLSGILKSFELKVIDSIIYQYSEEKTLEYITSFSPDWVISLVSAVGWEEEKSFLSSLKENNPNVKIGIMVETPAAVQIINDLCEEGMDFVSFGTNDLTQLTLGLDRDSELVSHVYDERNDAVKTLVASVINKAKANKRKIGICGEAASIPEFAEFLVECGIDSVSVVPVFSFAH